MSRVVIGVGASHTTLMNTKWDEVDHLDRAHRFRDALGAARQAIVAADADVAVVIGPNHFRGFWLDLMPTFTLGVGEVVGAGEHGTPGGSQPADPLLAHHLLDHLVGAGIDMAFSSKLQVDHGITHAIQYVVPEGMPVIPLVVNCFAPPLPTLARCATVGTVLAEAIAAHEGERRVAVVASGGLSHQLPFPDWRHPVTDDDRYLVESWMEGRSSWERYEPRRRQIVVGAPPRLDEAFDLCLLDRLEGGSLADLAVAGPEPVAHQGGNGAAEVRNWLAMAAACGWAPGSTLCYSPMPEWLTGMAVAMIGDPVPSPVRPTEESRP